MRYALPVILGSCVVTAMTLGASAVCAETGYERFDACVKKAVEATTLEGAQTRTFERDGRATSSMVREKGQTPEGQSVREGVRVVREGDDLLIYSFDDGLVKNDGGNSATQASINTKVSQIQELAQFGKVSGPDVKKDEEAVVAQRAIKVLRVTRACTNRYSQQSANP